MSDDQEADNPVAAVVTAVKSLSSLVNITTASINSLTYLVEEKLQRLESSIAEEKQRNQKENRSGISEKAVNDEINLNRREYEQGSKEKVNEEKTEAPETEMHQESDEERNFENWCQYKDAFVAIKYNSKVIKNFKISYSVASNLEEAVDPKSSVHRCFGSSDSDSSWANRLTEEKHLLLGDQIVLDGHKMEKKSMNSDELHEKRPNHATEGETDKIGAHMEIMNSKERCDPTDEISKRSAEHNSAERVDKPAGIPAAENDGVKLICEPIRKWLRVVAEKCYKPDGYLIIGHYELLCRAFNYAESPDLKYKATKHFGIKFRECEVREECRKLKVKNIWNALMHVIDMCRVNDEMYGTNDLEKVINTWSIIVPFIYNSNQFQQVPSFSNIENSVGVVSMMPTDMDSRMQLTDMALLERYDTFPTDEKNQNAGSNTFNHSELIYGGNNLITEENETENSVRRFLSPKSDRKFFRELEEKRFSPEYFQHNYNVAFFRPAYPPGSQTKSHVSITTGSGNRKTTNYAHRPSVRAEPNYPIKSMIEKWPENVCDILPLTCFRIMRAVAEELVSKSDTIDEWHSPLARLIQRNGLPRQLGCYNKWRALASRVRNFVTREHKIEEYYHWLMSIMKACIDKDGNECGTHCKKVMEELLDLKPSVPEPRRNNQLRNVRLNNRKVNDGARLGQPSRRAFAVWSSDESESGVQKKDSEASKSVSDYSTLGTLLERPFPVSAFGERISGLGSKWTPYTGETVSTSPESRQVTAAPVNCKRSATQSTEQCPDKGLAKADVQEEDESDKTSKPEQKRGKRDDPEYIMSDVVATNTDGENPRILIKMDPRGSQNP